MPSMTIENESSLNANDAFVRIQQLLAKDEELKRFDQEYKCYFDQAARRGLAQGKKFKAEFEVIERGVGSLIRVAVSYPIFLIPLVAQLKQQFEEKISRVLA
jgi:hypothetical protein